MKFLDKANISSVIEQVLDLSINTIDKLDFFENDDLYSSIPFGKLAKYIYEKKKDIEDIEEAHNKVLLLAYFFTLIRAIKRYSPKIELKKDDYLKNNTVKFQTKDFSLDNFYSNISSFAENHINSLIINNTKIKNNIINYLKSNIEKEYYILLDSEPILFKSYSKYLNSKMFSIENKENRITKLLSEYANLYNKVVLNDEEGITLNDIYILPEYLIHTSSINTEKIIIDDSTKNFININKILEEKQEFNLHTFLDKIIFKEYDYDYLSSNNRAIFLFGFPGQGKSSFTKRLAYEIVNKDCNSNFFFLTFRNIKNISDLVADPIGTLTKFIKTTYNIEVTELELRNSFLVLDGLDELYMKDNLKLTDIEDLCNNFIDEVSENQNFSFIITSRLNYVNIDKLKRKNPLLIQLEEFNTEQQIEWLTKYKSFYDDCSLSISDIKIINKERYKYKHIKELITQPIILYLIVKSNNNLLSSTSRTDIYEKLFDSLIKRNWEKTGQIKNLQDMNEKKLRKFIKNLAFEIYLTGNGYINKGKLLKSPILKDFYDSLNRENIFDSLKTVMIAFYLDEVKKNNQDVDDEDMNDYAIEFLHKSLQEYMTAEKMYSDIISITDYNKEEEEFYKKEEDVLNIFYALFSENTLSNELIEYLDEIFNKKEDNRNEFLKNRLLNLFDGFLETDFLINITGIKNPLEKSANTFLGFWSILKILENEENFITNDFRKNKVLTYMKILSSDKIFLDFSYQDFSDTDFENIILQNVSLHGVNLKDANLLNVYMGDVDIDEFIDSRIQNALSFYQKEDMGYGIFYNSYMRDSNFEYADLNYSNFQNTYMNNVDFRNSKFKNSDFTGADLTDAKFDETFVDYIIKKHPK
ncbi:hypothetical protein CRV01_04150 [Arcobacter sp. CECT 8983]|uniref:pentapeptide repeat-containing protein n=1 Tax=Arcobacter sp. CECT 8983 TaxID=2044508 RepID=UPI00100C2F4E|nr:pentapeptide repeat-containing protein [Arcobacter sp. CECT 8983]RXJ90356.1 hypothetical protein CRV01_04150 [Arcobacter sp. CECT 8983]